MKIKDVTKKRKYPEHKPKSFSVKLTNRQMDFMKRHKISPTALITKALEEVGFIE